MSDILDNLYALSESDRCKVFVTALRNIKDTAEENRWAGITPDEIEEILEIAAQPFWPEKPKP